MDTTIMGLGFRVPLKLYIGIWRILGFMDFASRGVWKHGMHQGM